MDAARPLKEVLDSLTGDAGGPAELAELPGDLLATAVGSYADTAPAEVAEHLAPLLESGATDLDAVLERFATVPTVEADEVPVDGLVDAREPQGPDDAAPLEEPALDFGTGHLPTVEHDVPTGDEQAFAEPDHESFDLPDHDATPDLLEDPADDVHELHLDPVALDDLDDLDDGFDDLDD